MCPPGAERTVGERETAGPGAGKADCDTHWPAVVELPLAKSTTSLFFCSWHCPLSEGSEHISVAFDLRSMFCSVPTETRESIQRVAGHTLECGKAVSVAVTVFL